MLAFKRVLDWAQEQKSKMSLRHSGQERVAPLKFSNLLKQDIAESILSHEDLESPANTKSGNVGISADLDCLQAMNFL